MRKFLKILFIFVLITIIKGFDSAHSGEITISNIRTNPSIVPQSTGGLSCLFRYDPSTTFTTEWDINIRGYERIPQGSVILMEDGLEKCRSTLREGHYRCRWNFEPTTILDILQNVEVCVILENNQRICKKEEPGKAYVFWELKSSDIYFQGGNTFRENKNVTLIWTTDNVDYLYYVVCDPEYKVYYALDGSSWELICKGDILLNVTQSINNRASGYFTITCQWKTPSICYDRELNSTRCRYIKNEERVHGKLKLEITCDGQRYCNQQNVSLIRDIWIINEDVTAKPDPFKVDIKKGTIPPPEIKNEITEEGKLRGKPLPPRR